MGGPHQRSLPVPHGCVTIPGVDVLADRTGGMKPLPGFGDLALWYDGSFGRIVQVQKGLSECWIDAGLQDAQFADPHWEIDARKMCMAAFDAR